MSDREDAEHVVEAMGLHHAKMWGSIKPYQLVALCRAFAAVTKERDDFREGASIEAREADLARNQLAAKEAAIAEAVEALESVSAYFDTESEQDCPSDCKLTEDVSTTCEYQPILLRRMRFAKDALARIKALSGEPK